MPLFKMGQSVRSPLTHNPLVLSVPTPHEEILDVELSALPKRTNPQIAPSRRRGKNSNGHDLPQAFSLPKM
jgi:hypothetical protein